MYSPYRIQVGLVSNDVLVVIALPDRLAYSASRTVYPPRGERLETTHDFRQDVSFFTTGVGGFQTRPYGVPEDDETVYMVWHDDKRVQSDVRIMVRQIVPTFVDDPPCVIKRHLPVQDVAKQALPVVSADGDEICSRLAVVVAAQTY